MAKYKDKRVAGRSKLVPFKPGEPAMERHRRRKRANVSMADNLRGMIAMHGLELRIHNNGHHWQVFRTEDAPLVERFTALFDIVEWWPSSAKCVARRQWRNGIHVHDINQLFTEIKRVFGIH